MRISGRLLALVAHLSGMIYDNVKIVVDAIFAGKERQFNRRFLTLVNHYMFEPVARTPESGW